MKALDGLARAVSERGALRKGRIEEAGGNTVLRPVGV